MGPQDEVFTARVTCDRRLGRFLLHVPRCNWSGTHECKQRIGYAWEMGLLRSKEVSRAEGGAAGNTPRSWIEGRGG